MTAPATIPTLPASPAKIRKDKNMKRIQNLPAARPRKTLARSAVLLALALAAPASARTLAPGVLFEVTYAYDSLGRPASRTVNGELQVFEYDGRDRLVAVRAEDGSDIERYRYDAAGNILEKTVRGETTRFVYDAANQLVSRTDGSGTTAFAYDAAGRLVREGDRRFVYGNDGHVSRVLEGGAVVASFDYFLDGQIAAVHARGRTERFLWDGLAMAARGDRTFLNEPASTGGNPVASMGRSFLNDMLGSTVGVHDRKARTRTAVSMTLFGETDADEAYFTGKPALPELGYAFLVRSYRADLGKWQTRDPLGYPDGWNAMAYCRDQCAEQIDRFGALTYPELPKEDQSRVFVGEHTEWFGLGSTYLYYAVTFYWFHWELVGEQTLQNEGWETETQMYTLVTKQSWERGTQINIELGIAAEIHSALEASGVSASSDMSASFGLDLRVAEASASMLEETKTFSISVGPRSWKTVSNYQLYCDATTYLFKYKNGSINNITRIATNLNIPMPNTATVFRSGSYSE